MARKTIPFPSVAASAGKLEPAPRLVWAPAVVFCPPAATAASSQTEASSVELDRICQNLKER